ncbi:hypothetical protein HELRODRAFT_159253 [Helobdella robusta]|uniref:Peptidase M12B domain-containing protein n=1 Tax=Helobdella robusta TaxID=6412 RepID=T1ENT1_HELRO|nr:hypothetical protein HELRODRAFT_159253 [Helobdella robusta]ESO12675.1 hypothetical protein HELRODRAFT_159253 [Helobdella robusta]
MYVDWQAGCRSIQVQQWISDPAKHFPSVNKKIPPEPLKAERVNDKAKVVELYIVNDYSQVCLARICSYSFTTFTLVFINKQYLALGKNLDNTVARAQSIVHNANMLFQTQGIFLMLKGMETWIEEILPIKNYNDSYQYFGDWQTYKLKNIESIVNTTVDAYVIIV